MKLSDFKESLDIIEKARSKDTPLDKLARQLLDGTLYVISKYVLPFEDIAGFLWYNDREDRWTVHLSPGLPEDKYNRIITELLNEAVKNDNEHCGGGRMEKVFKDERREKC